MYKQIIALSFLVAVTNANVVGWRNCGSPMGTVHSFRATNCTQTPCVVRRGGTYILEVDATSFVNSYTLSFASVAVVLGIPITLISGNACDNLQVGQCPVLSGNTFTFSIEYTMLVTIPAIPLTVRNTVYNDFGDIGLCIDVDVVVV